MKLIKALLLAGVAAVLLGCASPREMLGWPADVPFVLSPAETSEFVTAAPVFSKRLERVDFGAAKVCLGCGDVSDTNGIGFDHIRGRMLVEFPALLRQQLQASTLFARNAAGALSLRATLTGLEQQSSVGASAERKSVLTSGAVLSTKLSVRYELLDGSQVVGSWDVTTTARSNSLAASTRLSENIDGALKRSLRALMLQIVADHSPKESARATTALASLHSEVDNKRIALAYLVYGATKTVTTTVGVIGDGLVVVGQNSAAISAGLNATAANMERSQRDYNTAYTHALLAGRPQTAAPAPAATPAKTAAPAQATAPGAGAPASTGSSATASKGAADSGTGSTARVQVSQAAHATPALASPVAAADNSRTAPREAAPPVPKPVKPRAAQWGPKGLEAVAICRQSTKSGKWVCNGPLDDQIIVDEPTLESALARQRCAGGEFVTGGPHLEGVQWNAYRCGHALGYGDYDLAKRYGLSIARRAYICPADQQGDGRCTTPYSGQDKAS